MSSNLIAMIAAVSLFIGLFVLACASIKFGLNWANIASVSWPKAFGLWLFIVVAQFLLAVAVGIVLLLSHIRMSEGAEFAVGPLLQFFAALGVVMLVYKASLSAAIRSILPLLIVSVGSLLLPIFVIRPYLYEGFFVPTNSMAPTLLGKHVSARCPRCGAVAYGSAEEARLLPPGAGLLMICSKELQSVEVPKPYSDVEEGDRFLACKFLKPQRWDLITFRLPSDPSVIHVKRLIGLPGETLEIKDGAIWIDGERIEPPESIRGIKYSPQSHSAGITRSGYGSTPVKLGPDEFFVLGDFVDRAFDARFWDEGATGHPPYAVPKENITGVVINIYWPMTRWTSLR
jgi:signal peptidase I